MPFGRQRLRGVVVGLAETSELPAERLAEPIAALGGPLPPGLVDLGLWVAREYCSTPSRGLELVLPPGRRQGRRRADRAAGRRSRPAGREALGGSERLGPKQRAALERLAAADGPGRGRSRSRLAEAARGARPGRALREEEVSRRPVSVAVGARGERPVLTPAQEAALDRITAGLDGEGGELLLHGVTGSGKTEVYLTATEAALERGRGVIVLVPEIGLTPQTVSRFEARFGDRVAVLHSGLSAGERRDEWLRVRRGEARVCVGPRSAVFAPVEGLGLIVVDEEHDSSYKQESDPRYDARDVARAPRARGAGDAGRRHRHAAARELGAPGAGRALRARRRLADAGDRGPRHARARRARGAAPRPHARGALAARRGQAGRRS